MVRKLFSLGLALALTLSVSAAAFADGAEEVRYEDMSTVTLTKEYTLTNSGTLSPQETFGFTALTCVAVEQGGVGVTPENAPVPTIGTISYSKGEAGSATAVKTATITLPAYTAVGIYKYTFRETDGGTAGVSYRGEDILLVVTVIEQDGKTRVAAVHTESEGGQKSGSFDNTYSAGSLSVSKQVTGLMGDREKPFEVKVTFHAPAGDMVKSDISYTLNGVNTEIPGGTGWTTKEVTISLKHGQTVMFTNIPYGVTYTVAESDYTGEGYDAPTYTYGDDTQAVDSASETVEIVNNKGGRVDTGVSLDSLPYVMLLTLVCGGMALLVTRKRVTRE